MQNIGNNAALLLRDDLPADDRRQALQTLHRELDTLKQFMDEVREAARPRPLERVAQDVNLALADVVDAVRAEASRRGLTLAVQLAPLGVDLALTTNGVKLPEMAHDLAAAGLRRVNVSLDSLRRERFLALTRRDELDRTLAGIDAAIDAGLTPVKVNAVVIRGVNDDEVVELAEFGRSRGVGMRFIEFMPLDADGAWDRTQVVPAGEILDRIHAVYPLADYPRTGARGHEPAERFVYADGLGDVGVIASVTEPFCGNCDRVRITAEGKFRTCLFAVDEFDLRSVLRADAGLDATDLDDRLASAVRAAVGTKWAGHRIGADTFERPDRSMSQIGG